MLIFPAIDMLGGQAVRLLQGDYAQKTEYGDPLAHAERFCQAGATCLHLVDLDGAKAGERRNFGLVSQIVAQTGLFTELGGGIRDEAAVEACLAAGVGRVILGTAALRDPAFTRRMAARHGERIAVGVDARDGKVAVEGWLETSTADAYDFCIQMRDIGVKYIIFTDISRDGAQKGANLAVYRRLAGIQGLCFTASGGVSSLEDITALREMGLYAAILGKALYSGAVGLQAALAAAGSQTL